MSENTYGVNDFANLIKNSFNNKKYRSNFFFKSGICNPGFVKYLKSTTNKTRLFMIITQDYWKTNIGQNLFDSLTKVDQAYSHTLKANYANSGAKSIIGKVAEDLVKDENVHFLIDSMKAFSSLLVENEINEFLCYEQLTELKEHVKHLIRSKSDIAVIEKTLRYLYRKKRFGEAIWWTFMLLLFQEHILYFYKQLPRTQYVQILTELSQLLNDRYGALINSQVSEVSEENFWPLRELLLNTAHGHIYLAGPSLMDAFDNHSNPHSIVDAVQSAILSHNLTEISILLTDPEWFDSNKSGYPKRDIYRAVETLQEVFYRLCEDHGVQLSIYFLPLINIDHVILTDEFMAFRSTKLWTADRKYKGAFCLYLADGGDPAVSEYVAHKNYLDALIKNCTKINPQMDVDARRYSLPLGSAKSMHLKWRELLLNEKYEHVKHYKLYAKQLDSFVARSWNEGIIPGRIFYGNNYIKTPEDLFKYENLLGADNNESQKVLLSYLTETQTLFNEVIKKHDSSEYSYASIYPSLDLGFPNNVQRLAGGFATGMLVTWNCGIDIVPIDATVNVCTSSIFKLQNFDASVLRNPQEYTESLRQLFVDISIDRGYSFSFTTGNHFFIIAKDAQSDNYYLVLHSSANELKNSYMGLYPVENNWYSDKWKMQTHPNGRYLRYLKDDDARHFIEMAHHFEQYNEEIHKYLAYMINGKEKINDADCLLKHHYYMPTDNSIALGTFVEKVGAEVPLFSTHGKPIYIFKLGKDNWQVDLGGKKGRVCVIPHGWGQEISKVDGIEVKNGQLILTVNHKQLPPIPISSKHHIKCSEKHVRDFTNGEEFLKIGSKYITGSITKVLEPQFEYSCHTVKD